MDLIRDLAIILVVAMVVAVLVYWSIWYLTYRKLSKIRKQIGDCVKVNGHQAAALSEMIKQSPDDTGIFEGIDGA